MGLFEREALYADDGSLMVTAPTQMESFSKITNSLGSFNVISSIPSMFSYDAADYFYTNVTAGGIKSGYLLFDMYEKRLIKSVFCSYKAHLDGGASANFKISIEGSNDNVTYTSISTASGSVAPDSAGFLTGGAVTYRYIKLLLEKTDAGAGYLAYYLYTFKILV